MRDNQAPSAPGLGPPLQVASAQEGPFTTRHGAEAGYPPKLLVHHLRLGGRDFTPDGTRATWPFGRAPIARASHTSSRLAVETPPCAFSKGREVTDRSSPSLARVVGWSSHRPRNVLNVRCRSSLPKPQVVGSNPAGAVRKSRAWVHITAPEAAKPLTRAMAQSRGNGHGKSCMRG